VTETLNQAKTRLAATAVEAEQVVEGIADRTDKYVRANPWQSVAIAALLGGAITLLITRLSRK
ncbi:MAG: C-terminal glycine zipper region, partial [Burkholderiales bacterium]|nr:C-terminal glycine zipper region [Burkholderiales bacterium]